MSHTLARVLRRAAAARCPREKHRAASDAAAAPAAFAAPDDAAASDVAALIARLKDVSVTLRGPCADRPELQLMCEAMSRLDTRAELLATWLDLENADDVREAVLNDLRDDAMAYKPATEGEAEAKEPESSTSVALVVDDSSGEEDAACQDLECGVAIPPDLAEYQARHDALIAVIDESCVEVRDLLHRALRAAIRLRTEYANERTRQPLISELFRTAESHM